MIVKTTNCQKTMLKPANFTTPIINEKPKKASGNKPQALMTVLAYAFVHLLDIKAEIKSNKPFSSNSATIPNVTTFNALFPLSLIFCKLIGARISDPENDAIACVK